MDWRERKLKELESRSGLLIEMEPLDPAGFDAESTPEDDRGIVAVIPSWENRTTLVVEAGVDSQGDGFVIASAFDVDGEPIEPDVLVLDETVMIRSRPLDTSVREG